MDGGCEVSEPGETWDWQWPDLAAAEAQILTKDQHKPDPKRVGSHCRVDCFCGWKGPKVPMFGQGHKPWTEHFKAEAAA